MPAGYDVVKPALDGIYTALLALVDTESSVWDYTVNTDPVQIAEVGQAAVNGLAYAVGQGFANLGTLTNALANQTSTLTNLMQGDDWKLLTSDELTAATSYANTLNNYIGSVNGWITGTNNFLTLLRDTVIPGAQAYLDQFTRVSNMWQAAGEAVEELFIYVQTTSSNAWQGFVYYVYYNGYVNAKQMVDSTWNAILNLPGQMENAFDPQELELDLQELQDFIGPFL